MTNFNKSQNLLKGPLNTKMRIKEPETFYLYFRYIHDCLLETKCLLDSLMTYKNVYQIK